MTAVALPLLHRRFHQPKHFERRTNSYRLLPFRFARLDHDRYVMTNFAGEFVVVDRAILSRLISGELARGVQYDEFLSKHFILDDSSDVALDLLSTKFRTKQDHLATFTGLHIFVVTLRCDHSCPYCQVSRVSSDKAAFDMSSGTADRAIEFLFQSPNRRLKVEFQGGESLLNFGLIQRIVEAVEARNLKEGRDVCFVIATNLAQIADEMLDFCRDHRILISTSLDGPRDLHNANRPRPGNDSYERTIAGINKCREALGHDSVSALMTTTKRSLDCPEAIVDEYVAQSFHSIFLRWLSPYGFAAKTGRVLGYPVEEWNKFYERGLRHVIALNRSGVRFREQYASTILRKMLTPFPTGYVDLQSPAGLGVSVVVYNYDGDVYASDEARMLAESGDKSFRLGNLHADSYGDVFRSERLLEILDRTMTEGTPCCHECAFEPFCGTDPIFHHATQGDMVGHRPTSAFCSRNMFVFRLLIRMLQDEPESRAVLLGWV